MGSRPGDRLGRLRAARSEAAVLTDFDGTLAPIVDDPTTAAASPVAVAALGRLVGRYATVGVVSGRPVSFLRERLGDDLLLAGLYGLETWSDGRLEVVPAADEWHEVVAATVARARAVFAGCVEDKGLSLTIHVRTHPELEAPVRAWAAEESARTGLEVRPAKASVELHPPVGVDKGTVIERIAPGHRAMCFIGDDVGDLPAFAALDRLEAAGLDVVRVAVVTSEAPPALLARADVVVDGTDGVVDLLAGL